MSTPQSSQTLSCGCVRKQTGSCTNVPAVSGNKQNTLSMLGCHRGLSPRVVTEGCHRGLSPRVVTEGCHRGDCRYTLQTYIIALYIDNSVLVNRRMSCHLAKTHHCICT